MLIKSSEVMDSLNWCEINYLCLYWSLGL